MPKRLNASLSGSVLTADRSMPASPRVEMMQLLDGGAFGAVFESSGEALIVMDSVGTIHRVNSRSKEMLRYTEAGERQKKLADLISAPSETGLLSWCKRAAASADPKGRHNLQSIDGAFANGFPARFTLRSLLPGSGHLLLCVEDGSIAKRSEERTINSKQNSRASSMPLRRG